MCDFCGVFFNQRSGLYIYKLIYYNNNLVYICLECGKVFKYLNYLRSYFVVKYLKYEDIVSYGCRIYICEICQKFFLDKSDLRFYMNKYIGLFGFIFFYKKKMVNFFNMLMLFFVIVKKEEC